MSNAYRWYALAAKLEVSDAADSRDKAGLALTDAQKAAADAQVVQFAGTYLKK